MNLLTLSLAHIRTQPLTTLLTLLLLTLGVGTIVVLLLFSTQLEERLTRDTQGIDLVVGAKGSPLQLILSTVYQVDVPTGNIPMKQAEIVNRHPLVATTIPLALGDAVAGFRIVGTRHAYIAHYGAELASGRLWKGELEAVLGATVTSRTGLSVGDRFEGSHGISGEGHAHSHHPYRVVGILKPTGTTLDRLVVTGVESVWKVHQPQSEMVDPSPRPTMMAQPTTPSEEITALLVKYRSPVAAVSLPQFVNTQSALQAASPAFEITRLLSLIGVGLDVLRAFAWLLIATATLSIFIALYSALKRRQFDLAIMRTLGASRLHVLWFIILEGLLLSVGGTISGLFFGHLAAEGVAIWLRSTQQLFFTGTAWVPEEFLLLLVAVVIGMVTALLPAVRAYRLDIAAVLAERQSA